MKVQQAKQVIANAAHDFTIKSVKQLKARKGYKIVQVKYIQGVVTESKYRIIGRGYFWNDAGKKELCYALEVPEDEAEQLIKDFENAKAENRRKYRHRIWNKKRTKLIMCPFKNSCSKCPFADHPEEIFPSEAEENQPLSLNEINEERVYVAPESYGSAESMDRGIQMREMLEAIRALNNQLLLNFVSLLNSGCECDEMMDELGLDLDGIKGCYDRYIVYKNEYLD